MVTWGIQGEGERVPVVVVRGTGRCWALTPRWLGNRLYLSPHHSETTKPPARPHSVSFAQLALSCTNLSFNPLVKR